MIRLVPHPTFKARVRFTQPGADDALIDIEFRHKAPTVLADWIKDSGSRPVADALSEVIVGWSGVVDENGTEVPFSRDTLALFLASHATRSAELFSAYWKELTESRQKN